MTELALTIVSALIRDSGLRRAPRAARERAERALSSGAAEAKFREMIEAQGGDLEAFEREPAARTADRQAPDQVRSKRLRDPRRRPRGCKGARPAWRRANREGREHRPCARTLHNKESGRSW